MQCVSTSNGPRLDLHDTVSLQTYSAAPSAIKFMMSMFVSGTVGMMKKINDTNKTSYNTSHIEGQTTLFECDSMRHAPA